VSATTIWDCGQSPATGDIERDTVVTQAVSIMRRGGLVVLPTENCYVVATDAFSLRGTGLLRRAKVQASGTPLGLLLGSTRMVAGVAARIPERARELMDAFWPGMLTLLLPAQPTLAWDHPAGAPVAVRMPLHPLTLAICAELGPMAASAASIVGGEPPVTVEQAIDSLVDDVDAVCDVGPVGTTPWSTGEQVALASTVVDLSSYPAAVVREGAIATARVEAVLRPERGDTVAPTGHSTD
jgi:tRNA threonylcarbamoyl adenosine modification protein (Sua5/YciO/YrdC/YwlC family)